MLFFERNAKNKEKDTSEAFVDTLLAFWFFYPIEMASIRENSVFFQNERTSCFVRLSDGALFLITVLLEAQGYFPIYFKPLGIECFLLYKFASNHI